MSRWHVARERESSEARARVLPPAPQLPLPFDLARLRQPGFGRLVIDQFELGKPHLHPAPMQADQADAALLHVGEAVLPAVAVEHVPQRAAREEGHVPALAAGQLDRLVPHRRVEQVPQRVGGRQVRHAEQIANTHWPEKPGAAVRCVQTIASGASRRRLSSTARKAAAATS
jgi:hypothetical protein